MINHFEKIEPEADWLINFHFKFLSLANFLYLNPHALFLSYKHIVQFFLFFNSVEIIDNDSDEQIYYELTANNHEYYEVNDVAQTGVFSWLVSNASIIDSRVHHLSPAFSCHHFEESKHRINWVVKILVFIDPTTTLF